MKTKKFLSLVLAMVMALSLAVPAFASTTTANETALTQSTSITGTTEVPTIKITVPPTGSVVLNPYEMGVDVEGTTFSDPIISVPQYVINASNVAVKVSATVTGKTAGNAKLIAAAPAADDTLNDVYMEYQYEIGDDDTVDPDGTNKIVVATRGTATALGTLAQGTGTAAAATGAYLGFKLDGSVVAVPAKAWTTKDTVSVTVAYTFEPQKYVAAVTPPSAGDASVSLDNSTLTLDSTTTTSGSVQATFNAGTSGLTAASYAWATDNACVTLTNDNTATVTVAHASTGTANVTVTVTLSNGATVTKTCVVTCNA